MGRPSATARSRRSRRALADGRCVVAGDVGGVGDGAVDVVVAAIDADAVVGAGLCDRHTLRTTVRMGSASPAAGMLRGRIVVTDRCATERGVENANGKTKKTSTAVAVVALGEVAVGSPWRRRLRLDDCPSLFFLLSPEKKIVGR